MTQWDERLDLFHGDASANRATIYARLRDVPTGEGYQLSGYLRGPHSLYSNTLPSTIRFLDAGPGETVLSKALLPDPCYWTPELPFLYDVHLEVRRGEETVATLDRTLGIRNFGPRGKFFYQDGKRWVMRGAFRAPAMTFDLRDWHQAPLTLVESCPADEICDEASRVGVMILAVLQHDRHDFEREMRRLARHAAVAIVALDVGTPGVPLPTGLSQLAPNLLVARFAKVHHHAFRPAEAASEISALLGIMKQPDSFARLVESQTVPVIAYRSLSDTDRARPHVAREKCDRLQAELAPFGDFAGYIV